MLTINSNTTGRDRAIDADTGSVFYYRDGDISYCCLQVIDTIFFKSLRRKHDYALNQIPFLLSPFSGISYFSR